MAKLPPDDDLAAKIVRMLSPLSKEERRRIIAIICVFFEVTP